MKFLTAVCEALQITVTLWLMMPDHLSPDLIYLTMIILFLAPDSISGLQTASFTAYLLLLWWLSSSQAVFTVFLTQLGPKEILVGNFASLNQTMNLPLTTLKEIEIVGKEGLIKQKGEVLEMVAVREI